MPPQQPFIPTIDPNSAIGRRLLERDRLAATPQGRVDALPSLDGMADTNDPRFQAMLRQQTAALGPPPAALLPAAPAAVAPAPSPATPANPTPDQLAAGQTPLAPVPVQDPFRLNDPGLGRVAGSAGVPPGDVIPYNPNDPRSRNPFLYQDGDVWRSSVQRGSMTGDGFTPGFVTNGLGGSQVWAQSPADFLIAMQQNARAQGVNPGQLAEQFLTGLNAGADRSGRAGVAAQQGNVNLATGRMQADAQRYGADRSADAAGRAAAFGAIPGFVAGLSAGNIPGPLAEMIGNHITTGLQGGPRPGSATPFGGPMVPGGPAPGAPGAPAGGNAPGNPFASLAASGDALRPFQSIFGTRNPQTGMVARPEGFNMGTSVNTMLDRLHTATPEQRQAVMLAIERGDMGDPTELLTAIGRRGGVASLRAMGGATPGSPRAGNMLGMVGLGPNMPFLGSEAQRPHVIVGPNGQPAVTFRANPNQNAIAASLGVLGSAGVGPNQVLYPGFDPIDFSRSDVSSPFNAPGSTQAVDQRHGLTAREFLQLSARARAAAGGR